ncbi:MAG: beta-ketoacyl synthase N-terminal-like domain-containing protein [Candidatus Cryptobacteroides sp.]
MVEVLGCNVFSPLGADVEQNYLALRSGGSALRRREMPGCPVASLFENPDSFVLPGFSRFESMVVASVSDALARTCIDQKSDRCIFILSTTKADVECLETVPPDGYLSPAAAARKVARHFGMVTEPVVVSNACISGVSAQVLAARLIDLGKYDTAIVCGADCISPFAVAGFSSFKALSPQPCRPFDIERTGLNLGEAAATIIFGKSDTVSHIGDDFADAGEKTSPHWHLLNGSLTNDAYHLSAPSPTGEGCFRAIVAALSDFPTEKLAAIGVHGTATMFNDQMESRAIERAGLSDVPLSTLKGCYGHTLGAAGVLETVMLMLSLEDGVIPANRGFEEIGVGGKVNIVPEEVRTDGKAFLKVISGFGGCNGAILYSRDPYDRAAAPDKLPAASWTAGHSVRITPTELLKDGHPQQLDPTGKAALTALYKQYIADYPKFYKMDGLCRLAFVASELLLQASGTAVGMDPETTEEAFDPKDTAILIFNRNSSIASDCEHIASISDPGNYYPSPSVFLYTLPNILTGEIAIRNGFTGETSLCIVGDCSICGDILEATMAATPSSRILAGWIDYENDETFEADLKIYNRNQK